MSGVVLQRTEGREFLIGDHTVVSVLSIEMEPPARGAQNKANLRPRVKLDISSPDRIQRVDNAITYKLAAEAKLAASRVAARRSMPMEEVPIYVLRTQDGELAGVSLGDHVLTELEGSFNSRKVVKQEDLGPDDPSMVVIRVMARRDVEVVKKLLTSVMPQMEHRSTMENSSDGMFYLLFVIPGARFPLRRVDAAA